MAQLFAADAQGLQAEGHVLTDVEMRKEGVVLEDHAEPARHWSNGGDIILLHEDAPGVRYFEACQQPQRRGLPAATGSQKRQDLTPLEGE